MREYVASIGCGGQQQCVTSHINVTLYADDFQQDYTAQRIHFLASGRLTHWKSVCDVRGHEDLTSDNHLDFRPLGKRQWGKKSSVLTGSLIPPFLSEN